MSENPTNKETPTDKEKTVDKKKPILSEKLLVKVRTASLLAFYLLLAGGVALVGIGAATGQILYLIDGGVVLVTSPIFLAMNQFAKDKEKHLGT